MKMGRFVVDGHIHCGKKDTAKKDSPIQGVQSVVESVDNSDMALFDMDAYGIDMGILLPSFNGTHSEAYAAICRKHPDKFRTCAVETELRLDAMKGKRKWNIDEIAEIFSRLRCCIKTRCRGPYQAGSCAGKW